MKHASPTRLALCGLAFCLIPNAVAQDSASSQELMEVGKTDRVQLHPGEALKIRGIGQGANDFLASTPALRSAPSAIELVAAEEAHSRRLAMYSGGKRFTSAPSRSQRFTASEPHEPMESLKTSRPGTETPEQEPPGKSNKYLLPGVLIGLVLLTMKKIFN